jgi:hypothetical protein
MRDLGLGLWRKVMTTVPAPFVNMKGAAVCGGVALSFSTVAAWILVHHPNITHMSAIVRTTTLWGRLYRCFKVVVYHYYIESSQRTERAE